MQQSPPKRRRPAAQSLVPVRRYRLCTQYLQRGPICHQPTSGGKGPNSAGTVGGICRTCFRLSAHSCTLPVLPSPFFPLPFCTICRTSSDQKDKLGLDLRRRARVEKVPRSSFTTRPFISPIVKSVGDFLRGLMGG